MNIYVGHATATDYRTNLYEPLRESHLADDHTLVFPHDDSDELFDSHSFFQDECDLVLAEVSTASTGLGIELGWADQFDVPILCIHHADADPSRALQAVTDDIHAYTDTQELVDILATRLD